MHGPRRINRAPTARQDISVHACGADAERGCLAGEPLQKQIAGARRMMLRRSLSYRIQAFCAKQRIPSPGVSPKAAQFHQVIVLARDDAYHIKNGHPCQGRVSWTSADCSWRCESGEARSLLNWTQNMLRVRGRHRAFGRGSCVSWLRVLRDRRVPRSQPPCSAFSSPRLFEYH
jgi:hypothetical protein